MKRALRPGDRAARGAGVDRAAGRAVAPRADRRRAAARGHAARAAGARRAGSASRRRRCGRASAGSSAKASSRSASTGRAFVSRLTREDFEEIYAARLGLEGLAARLGAEAVGPAELARMRKTLGKLERAAAAEDVDAYLALRWEFYGTLLPGERPAAPRRGGRAALLALRALQPPRALDRAALPGVARPLRGLLRELRGERRARRRARRSRTVFAGRSTASRAGCRRKRSSA